jgi:hypothetical protein
MDLTPDQLAFIRRKRKSFAEKKRAIMASIVRFKDPWRTFKPSITIECIDLASAQLAELRREILAADNE